MPECKRKNCRTAIRQICPEAGRATCLSFRECRRHSRNQIQRSKLVARNGCQIFTVDLDSAIEPAHCALVQPSAQQCQRRDRSGCASLELGGNERRRFVWWKEMLVIDQRNEIVAR